MYLVRFVVGQEDHIASAYQDKGCSAFGESPFRRAETSCENTFNHRRASAPNYKSVKDQKYPASVSIDVLLKAGKLIKPKSKSKVTLSIEEFDVVSQQWKDVNEVTASKGRKG